MRDTYLTERALLWFIGIQITGSFALVYSPLLLLYLSGSLWWGWFLLAERRRLPRHDRLSLTASLPPELRLEEAALMTIKLHFEDSLSRSVSLSFIMPELSTLAAKSRLQVVTADISTNGTIAHAVSMIPIMLGYEEFSSTVILVDSPSGMLRKRYVMHHKPVRFRVEPQYHQVSPSEFSALITRQSSFRSGLRTAVRHRGADQFFSIREYQYPDSLSRIDSRKSAKLQKLMTRTYDAYRNYHLIIALDSGRTMRGKIASSHKFDYYLSAALHLARNAIAHHDTVSFLVFAKAVRYTIRSTRSFDTFRDVYRGTSLRPVDEDSNFLCLPPIIRSLTGQRSIIIMLTDLARPSSMASVLETTPAIATKHLSCVITLADDTIDPYPLTLSLAEQPAIDLEDYADILYALWMEQRIQTLRQHLSHFGSSALTIPERQWMSTTQAVYEMMRKHLWAG